MKKLLFSFILLVSAILMVGCSRNPYEYLQNLNQYNIQIQFDDKDNKLVAKQQVEYVNKSNDLLSYLKFHLYANAFKKDAKANVVSVANFDKAYPNGESFGEINIFSVEVGEKNANYQITGEDQNILQIDLFEKLYPDEKVCVCFEYDVVLANINHRLGYGNNAINLCNFYPIACVYENGDFVCDLYNSNGDPFYSEVADYNVTIKYPNDYILACTGQKMQTTEQEDTCATIKARCVRDFGMVLSKKFQQQSSNDQIVKVNYYYYDDEKSGETIDIICKAFEYFENVIGKYPYSQISIVQTNFVHGGMEYPNMVLVSDDISDYSTYQLVVVHELCHQWWYGVVGNNQYKYGWIDEGLTEFCTVMFFDNHQEYSRTMENMIMSATQNYTTFMRVYSDVLGQVDTSMNRTLNEFKTEPEYVYNTYVKGMLMFSSVYEFVGQKRFETALAYYYNNNLYKISTPAIVIKDFSVATKRNLENMFNSWLLGKVKIVAK